MTGDAAVVAPPRDPADAQAMLDALERLRGTAVEYHGFLANHGPMAADAIIRLGGRDQVAGWVDDYVASLEPARPPTQPISMSTWSLELGQPERVSDWVRLFTEAIADTGWRGAIDTWWPRLLPGIAASAAHGVIRTAHAIRNLVEYGEHEPLLHAELAQGLGLWAARYQPLPAPVHRRGDLDLGAAIAALPRLDPGAPPTGPGIGGRLGALDRLDEYAAALGRWNAPSSAASGLDQIVEHTSRKLVANAQNQIPLCHAITAPAAVRMVLPALPEDVHESTLLSCWALAAAIITAYADPAVAAPQQSGMSSDALPSNLAQEALDHGDEHVLKLTAAALHQQQLTGDATMLVAAHALAHRLPAVGQDVQATA